MLPVICNAAGLPRLTKSSTPSKCTALPYLPAVHVGPLTSVPASECPDASAVVVPEPSLNAYAATALEGGIATFDTVTLTTLESVVFVAASRARAVSTWTPFPTAVVSHETE